MWLLVLICPPNSVSQSSTSHRSPLVEILAGLPIGTIPTCCRTLLPPRFRLHHRRARVCDDAPPLTKMSDSVRTAGKCAPHHNPVPAERGRDGVFGSGPGQLGPQDLPSRQCRRASCRLCCCSDEDYSRGRNRPIYRSRCCLGPGRG